MAPLNPSFRFKGDPFLNRYRLTGILMARSPIHIGTGVPRTITDEDGEDRKIDTVAVDAAGFPYLPGSSLRGVVRNYLLQIFRAYGSGMAADRNYEGLAEKSQDGRKEYIKQEASLLEQVFGTPFSESKVEFWDAPLVEPETIQVSEGLKSKGWNDAEKTYVVRSVAIDPMTGAAEPNKLYSFDVVPAGARFEVTISGHNLDDLEWGLVLFGLQGFNSQIYPLTIGAMSSRGFGRMSLEITDMAYVNQGNFDTWIESAVMNDHAGYDALPRLSEQERLDRLEAFKTALHETLRGD